MTSEESGKDNYAAGREAAEHIMAMDSGGHPGSSPAHDRGPGMNQHVSQRATPPDRARVTRFFGGLELVPPGVVRVPEWRPETAEAGAAPSTQWGGVGRKV
jgi:S-adenosyl methyltransferase